MFKGLLDHAEYMTPYVRALAIHGQGSDQDISVFPDDGEWLRLLTRMPQLSYLRLEGFRLYIPGGLRLSLRSWFSGIRALHLESMRGDGDSLASLIRASASLETLVVQSTPALQDVPQIPSLSAANPLRSVSTLIWHPNSTPGSATHILGRWATGTQLPIQKLSIRSIGTESTPPTFVQQLLDASAQSLEHLHLEFALTATRRAIDQLSLVRSAQLKTLHMVLPMDILMYSLKIFLVAPHICPEWTTLELRVHLRETLLEELHLLTARRVSAMHATLRILADHHPSLRVTATLDASQFLSRYEAVAGPASERRRVALDYARGTLRAWQHMGSGNEMKWNERVRFVTVWDPQHAATAASSGGRGEEHHEPEWYHSAQAPWDSP